MQMFWAVVTLLAGVEVPHAAELDLPAMVAQAPIIVLARVADPRLDVQDLPVPGAPGRPFQRLRRHLELLAALRGQAPSQLRVDEPAWAAQLAQRRTCREQTHCQPLPVARYRGQLSREPNPRQNVLVFLKKNAQGELELAADFAFDRADRAPEVRALLQATRAGGRR